MWVRDPRHSAEQTVSNQQIFAQQSGGRISLQCGKARQRMSNICHLVVGSAGVLKALAG